MWNKEETIALTDFLLVCHRPSVFGLGQLKEDGIPTQQLDMGPVAMVYTEMAST